MKEFLTPDVIEGLVVLIAAVALIATPILIVLAKKAARALGEMAGVKVTSEHEALIEKAVRTGVSYAQEQGHKLARGLLEDGPKTPAEKLEVAKTAARTLAPKALRDVGDTELEVMIEAEVHQRKRLASIAPGAQLVTIPPPPTSYLPPLTVDALNLPDTVAGRPSAKRRDTL